jgi:phosphatidylserine/phosphatidylglycerophosphate/cardiolipin synthase-like enzyme
MASNELLIGKEYVKKVIPLLDNAKHSITICMFIWRWYPKDPFSDISQLNSAFVRAVRRGVKVYAVTQFGTIIETLKAVGIDAHQHQSSDVLHTKAIIIDSEIAITGSHNFSASAMFSNVETSTINYEPELAVRLETYIKSLP